jgi:hypothetical protein
MTSLDNDELDLEFLRILYSGPHTSPSVPASAHERLSFLPRGDAKEYVKVDGVIKLKNELTNRSDAINVRDDAMKHNLDGVTYLVDTINGIRGGGKCHRDDPNENAHVVGEWTDGKPDYNTTTTTTLSSPGVVQTMYGFVKDAWAKGKYVPVVSGVFDVTESVAAIIINRNLHKTTTGNNKGLILLDIDERIVKPRMKMIDDEFVSPSIAEVCRVVAMVVQMVNGMVISPIASRA